MMLFNPGPMIARGTGAGLDAMQRYGIEAMRDGESPVCFLERMGTKLFQAWRDTPAESVWMREKAGPKYNVAGHVDLTTVTADGVTVKRLHTWKEDRVGHLIDPFKGRRGDGMNRQQRRAAARLAA